MLEYTHTPLGEEVTAVAGYYWKTKEDRLSYKEKEALYFLGNTSTICSCYGECPPFEYIMVPGYVKDWQYRKNEKSLPVSLVEPIRSEEEREEIKRILQEKYQISQVEFW